MEKQSGHNIFHISHVHSNNDSVTETSLKFICVQFHGHASHAGLFPMFASFEGAIDSASLFYLLI